MTCGELYVAVQALSGGASDSGLDKMVKKLSIHWCQRMMDQAGRRAAARVRDSQRQ